MVTRWVLLVVCLVALAFLAIYLTSPPLGR
jgi:hypothetical protein